MGDSWEDEEFEVQLPVASGAPSSWEDEVEEPEPEPVKAVDPALLQKQKELQKKKEQDDAVALSNKLKQAELAAESPAQRKLREKQELENAELATASELFDSGMSKSAAAPSSANLTSGIAGAQLKTIKDHENFAITVASKLEDSTSFNIASFYIKLTEQIKGKLSLESLEEVTASLNTLKEKKKATEPKPKVAAKKTVSQIKKETKRHADVFGGEGDYDDKYDSYAVSPLTTNAPLFVLT